MNYNGSNGGDVMSQVKNYTKLIICLLIIFLMLVGCQKNETKTIYNTWVCTNKAGPTIVINEDGTCYQYNNRYNHEVNYLSGKTNVVKVGDEAKKDLDIENMEDYPYFEDMEHVYSIKLYFDKYVDANGVDNSNLIQEGEYWWYTFKLVGNGRANVVNVKTQQAFYCEVLEESTEVIEDE